MDRQIVYPGQIPLETDLLNTNRNTMLAIGKLAAAMFGTGGIVNGLAVSPTSPASLSVSVGAGEIYQLANVDDTDYSSLPADTTDTLVKQGILLQAATLSCPAPTTAGFSINYLIEAKFQESDTGSVVLPYYNASNPQQAYSGPNNTGAAQAVTRAGTVSLQAKAGIAATTGTQSTPSVDAGWIAIAVVTVANGQSAITAGDIVAATGGQILGSPTSNGRLLNVQTFTATGTYTPTPGTNKVKVRVLGGGGAGGGASTTSAGQASTGAGGGAGGYAESLIASGFSGVTVTVGIGGFGGPSTQGGNGGASSFGALVTANGGTGGGIIGATANFGVIGGGTGGTASGGNIVNCQGGYGLSACTFGGANSIGTGGASSQLGGGGPGVGTSGDGIAAVGYGAGGGGANNGASQSTARKGGDGSPGIIIVEEYA